jgi:hypothetical protein
MATHDNSSATTPSGNDCDDRSEEMRNIVDENVTTLSKTLEFWVVVSGKQEIVG